MKTKILLFLVPLMTLMGVGSMCADNVAKVGETGYATFAGALEAWTGGTTLQLLADVTVDAEITVSNTRTLDLNGYGITQTASDNCLFIVASGGNLTISDSQPNISTHKFNVNAETHKAVFDAEGSYSFTGGYLYGGTGYDAEGYRGGAILVRNGGTLSITGGTLIGNSAPFGGAVAVQGGSFSMTGGTIIYNSNVRESATNHGGSAVWVQKATNNASFTIGGTARIEHNYTPTNSESDTKAQVSIFGSGATCTLSGGTPQIINGGNGANLQLLDGNVAAISGTFAEGANIGVSANASPRVFTADYATNNTAADPTAYLHSDSAKYVVCYDFINADAKLVSASGNVAQVSDGVYTERFSTIVGAMTEWSDGRTLTLLADVEITEEVEVGTKTVTLNLNGYGITQTTNNKCLFSVTSGGNLTISDGAPNRSIRRFSVGTTDHKAVLNEESGSLTFKGGYLTGGTGHAGTPVRGGAIYVNGGSLSMTGGTLIGNSAPYGGAVAVQGGSFSMTGGTILYNSNYRASITQHGGSAVWVQRDADEDADAQFTLGGTARIEHNYTPLVSNTPESAGQIVIYGTSAVGTACTLSGGTPKVFNSENGKNLILLNGNVATVTGTFGNGANIGITDSSAPRAFTSGYNTHNSGVAPYNYFKSDDALYDVILSGSEAALASAGLATTGLFSVSSTKKVRFATANVPGLVQWEWANDHADADANGWRVLNHEEWTYLLSYYGRANATDLNSLATVDGDSGLVILPDNWVKPAGIPEFNTAYTDDGYKANVYSASEWDLMAQSGAVFLPCEGYSSDSVTIVNATDHGHYWACDQKSATKGYTISFDDDVIHDQEGYSKCNYYSVRLVKDESSITVLNETHDTTTYNTAWTAAKTKDFAIVKRTMKKDSTLYTLCLPFDVPNVDASPLAGAEIFTFEGGRVGGSPGNERLYLSMKRLEGKRMTQGVPYIIRWAKTSPIQNIDTLFFYNVENWDDNITVEARPGNTTVKFQGAYPKTHIPGYETAEEAHYNFFIGANNTLYWPDDTNYAGHMMKGFRAYFYITPGGGPSSVSAYRGLQAVWEVDGAPLDSTEDVESVQPAAIGVQKELREEMIVIIIDGKMYDLQGRIVDID